MEWLFWRWKASVDPDIPDPTTRQSIISEEEEDEREDGDAALPSDLRRFATGLFVVPGDTNELAGVAAIAKTTETILPGNNMAFK